MPISQADVTNMAPELAGETSGRVDSFIALGANYVSESKFGTRYDHALCLFVCHMLTLANRRGAGGSVVSEKAGDLQRGYSSPPTDKELLLSTSYGQLFVQLRRTQVITPLVT
jgi:hypothetical protein